MVGNGFKGRREVTCSCRRLLNSPNAKDENGRKVGKRCFN